MNRGSLTWIVLVVIVAGIAAFFLFSGKLPSSLNIQTIPPYTPDTAATLKKSKGFQLLVSYTKSGFQPAIATIKKGQTIRFTNNAQGNLWVSAYGADLYPNIPGSCGESGLDSCKEIGRGEFWEFTFDKPGIWLYQNKDDLSKTGSVRVN